MRKTITITVLITALLMFLSPAAYADYAVVTGDEVNVRTGPGTAYAIFASLDHDTAVEVVNRSNPDWYLVSWDGSSGYISSQFLRITQEDSSAVLTVSRDETPGYIDGMYVSFRAAPGTDSTILGTYSTGKLLTITGNSGEWTAVRIDGNDGFVFSSFVREGSPNSAVVTTEGSDSYSRTPLLSAAASSEPSRETDGPTVFMVPESPTPVPSPVPAPEATLPPDRIVQVPTDGAAHAAAPAAEPSPDSEYVGTVEAGAGSLGTLIPVAESREVIVSTPVPFYDASAVSTPLTVEAPAESSADVGVSTPAPERTLGKITGNAVRLRSGPGATYSIIGTYDNGTDVAISGNSGEWVAVTLPSDGVSGYIHSDYIQTTDSVRIASDPSAAVGSGNYDPASFRIRDGFITGSCVRLRDAPSMSAGILDELNFGTSVRITGVSGEWTRVIANGREGYVYTSFVADGAFEPAANVSRATGTELGKEIAAYALQYVGTPYKWGGHSPETGFDCSGFVQYVFGQFGYTTSRVANDALSDGVHVDPADIQPGDLLCFFSGSNYVGHLGIYIGDDMFVHAANSTAGVVTTSLSSGYYATRGFEIRRII